MTDRFLRTHGIPASELPPLKSPFPEIKNLVQADVWLKGGESFQVGAYRLTVINTPGHTPGHVAYYEPRQRLLFAGDTLLPTIATNAATHIQQMPNPLKQYLNSLQHLRELDIELVLPGHEQPFTDHRLRIDQLLAHHTSRSTAVQTLVEAQNQPVNAYQVARLISWSPKNKAVHWEQLAALDKRFAMMQAIAHLEMLAAQKKLIRIALHGKISYQSVEKTD
jgi:glyoxylase-like metal-dependent hydrolase (beta-lactamase superfamily II)